MYHFPKSNLFKKDWSIPPLIIKITVKYWSEGIDTDTCVLYGNLGFLLR